MRVKSICLIYESKIHFKLAIAKSGIVTGCCVFQTVNCHEIYEATRSLHTEATIILTA
jgi:hypothetical protein